MKNPSLQSVWPRLMDLLCRYFRAEVKGLQHIPRTGSAIIIANHSSYPAADAVILAHLIHRKTGRHPRIMAHRAYFEWFRGVRQAAYGLGLREPHLDAADETLRHGHLLIIFPEGERGNFKSSLKRYQLQSFHSGFVRLARQEGVPVLPCVITGAEEAFLNWGSLCFESLGVKLRIPLPVNLIPLPSKWRIQFRKPIPFEDLHGPEPVEKSRRKLQRALNRAVQERDYVFFRA